MAGLSACLSPPPASAELRERFAAVFARIAAGARRYLSHRTLSRVTSARTARRMSGIRGAREFAGEAAPPPHRETRAGPLDFHGASAGEVGWDHQSPVISGP